MLIAFVRDRVEHLWVSAVSRTKKNEKLFEISQVARLAFAATLSWAVTRKTSSLFRSFYEWTHLDEHRQFTSKNIQKHSMSHLLPFSHLLAMRWISHTTEKTKRDSQQPKATSKTSISHNLNLIPPVPRIRKHLLLSVCAKFFCCFNSNFISFSSFPLSTFVSRALKPETIYQSRVVSSSFCQTQSLRDRQRTVSFFVPIEVK